MNTIRKAVLGLLITCAGHTTAQVTPFSWARESRSTFAGQGQTIARDASGNVYSIGYFQGVVDFDPGTGVQNLTATGPSDMYILKFNSAGNFVWVKQIVGSSTEYPHAIAVGSAGNIFVTGIFQGSADFDPGPNVLMMSSAGATDIFLLRLDQSGNLLTARKVGGPGSDVAYGLTVDGTNVYYTGSFSSAVDFDPGPGNVVMTAIGATDVFVSKLSPALTHIWSASVGSGGPETGTCIKVDGSGNVYAGGNFAAMIDFDPGVGVANVSSAGGSDGFIFSLDASGNYLWASACGGSGQDYLNALAIDAGGSLIGVGSFVNTADFDPSTGTSNLTSAGLQDGFIWKLTSSGSLSWVVPVGDVGNDAVYGVAADAMSRVYCSGEFVGTVDFDPSGSTQNLTSAGQSDAFMYRLTSAGGIDFVRQIGGGGFDGAYAIATNGSKILTNGYFQGTVDFDQESSVYNLNSPSPTSSYQHCFEELTKLDQSVCGVTLPSLAGNLPCVALAGATDYRYEITDPQNNVAVVYVGSSSASLPMSAYNFGYGITYNIRVSALIGSLWTSYGPACAVTIPPPSATTFQWAKQIGYSQPGLFKSLITASNGDLYALGAFLGTVDFDPGPGTYNLTSVGNADMFLLKLDAAGNFISVLHFSGSGSTMGNAINFDGSGNILLGGWFSGTTDFDPGSSTNNITDNGGTGDIFITKLNPAGNHIWTRTVGGTGQDMIHDFLVDGNNDIYYSGAFSSVVDVDPGSGTQNFTSAGSIDGFLTKLDASGNHLWSKQWGSVGADGTLGIEMDSNGDLILAGFFQNTVDFDPGGGTYNLVDNGGGDIVVHKMDASGNFIWARAAGGTSADQALSLAIASNDDIICTAAFQSVVDFDPGSSVYNLTSNGLYDGVVWKLSSAGNLVWAVAAGGTSGDGLYAVDLDNADNVYCSGGFMTTTDFDPGMGTCNLTPVGTVDAMLWKLNANGTFGWARQIGAPSGQVTGYAIHVSGNDVYSAGVFQNSPDFDQEAGVFNMTSATTWEGYIHKMGNFSSTQLWTGSCGLTLGSLNDPIYAVAYPGATDYRYEITNGNNVTVVTRGAASTDFQLINMTGVGYGVTYSIRVSAYVNSAWLPYGSSCNVTTPAPPVTQLDAPSCNISLGSFSQPFFCDPVLGATDYEYKFDDGINTVLTYQRLNSLTDVQMGWVTGALLSTYYDVQVRASVGGTWTPWGPKCKILTSPTPRLAGVDELGQGAGVSLFPNPTNGDANLDLGKHCRDIRISVMNVAGQQVSELELGYARLIELSLPPEKGVYFVQVNATGLEATSNLRIVKQ